MVVVSSFKKRKYESSEIKVPVTTLSQISADAEKANTPPNPKPDVNESEAHCTTKTNMRPAYISPRKPYKAKGSRSNRCDVCYMGIEYCICQQRKTAEATVEFWLIMHKEEVNKPTNTGRLIEHVLPENTRKFMWSRTEPEQSLIDVLCNAKYQPYIIFPDDREGYEHRLVTTPDLSSNKIPAYIILDGSWRQASRMFRLSQYLQNIPVLPIKSQSESTYKLRKAPNEGNLCTVEVAIAVLQMSQEQQAAETLAQYFDVFNIQYAKSRRNIKV